MMKTAILVNMIFSVIALMRPMASYAASNDAFVTDSNLCTQIRGVSYQTFRNTGGFIEMTIRNNDVYYIRNVIMEVSILGATEGRELPPEPILMLITDLIPPGNEYVFRKYDDKYGAIFRQNPDHAPYLARVRGYERVILPNQLEPISKDVINDYSHPVSINTSTNTEHKKGRNKDSID